jgi:hypothetical protein
MSYSKSLKTLQSRLPLLDKLQQGVGDQWVLSEHSDVDKFAYQIREALYIADLNAGLYPELALAHQKFRIEIVDRRTVQAVLRPEPTIVEGRNSPTVTTHGLVHGEKSAPDLMGPQTAASIIQAWHNMQPSNTPMHFPQANLDEDELERLYKWGMSRQPEWLLFVGLSGQLTLRMRQGNEGGNNWEPGDGA